MRVAGRALALSGLLVRSRVRPLAARSKAAVHADATLDFLKDTVAKAPELPAAAEGGGDSDGEGAKPKRVRKPRRDRHSADEHSGA